MTTMERPNATVTDSVQVPRQTFRSICTPARGQCCPTLVQSFFDKSWRPSEIKLQGPSTNGHGQIRR